MINQTHRVVSNIKTLASINNTTGPKRIVNKGGDYDRKVRGKVHPKTLWILAFLSCMAALGKPVDGGEPIVNPSKK